MEAFYGWLKNLICCLCILELLYHVVQNPDYQKYLRFFGGLIFLLLTLGPVFQLFGMQSAFETAFARLMRQEAAWELQEAADSLLGLANEKIEEACGAELERQIRAIIKEHGLEAAKVNVFLSQEDGVWCLKSVQIRLLQGLQGEGEQETEAVCAEISAVYGIARSAILVTGKG